MNKTLRIQNLSNSIPFYNVLFHTRPISLSYSAANYSIKGMHVHLIESPTRSGPSERMLAGSIHLPDALDFKKRFREVLRFQKAINNTHCKVLENSFQVSDPDGNIWLITNKLLSNPKRITETYPCYLEPINF